MGTSVSKSDEGPKLKCPGQFERLHDDSRRVSSCNTFEGAKFDVAKPLTPTFAVNHNFWLGGSYYPNANQHYKFGATLGDNERVCIASVDQHRRPRRNLPVSDDAFSADCPRGSRGGVESRACPSDASALARPTVADDPARVATTRRHGISTSSPRRRRDASRWIPAFLAGKILAEHEEDPARGRRSQGRREK